MFKVTTYPKQVSEQAGDYGQLQCNRLHRERKNTKNTKSSKNKEITTDESAEKGEKAKTTINNIVMHYHDEVDAPRRRKQLQKCVVHFLLFFGLVETVKFVIQCGSIFFEFIKNVMGDNFSRKTFEITGDVFSFVRSPPHNSQRIDPNTDATNNTTKTTHTNTTKHNQTQAHHPTSNTDTCPLHSKWHEVCTVMLGQLFHDTNMFGNKEWATALAFWHSRQARAVCTESELDERSLSLSLRKKHRELTGDRKNLEKRNEQRKSDEQRKRTRKIKRERRGRERESRRE